MSKPVTFPVLIKVTGDRRGSVEGTKVKWWLADLGIQKHLKAQMDSQNSGSVRAAGRRSMSVVLFAYTWTWTLACRSKPANMGQDER